MVETLAIFTLKQDGTSVPFPPIDLTPALSYSEQAKIGNYTFTAGRMGSTGISATLMYPICLDKIWTGAEYVEFRGEKYWIFTTPTSSKSHDDIRYKHELNFTSERVALDNTYFFDVVSPDATDVDQFVSNSTKFTFFGDIAEFVKRMNYSLQYSGLGYTIVLDDGVSSEGKLMSFEDKFFSDVLVEVFNTYELPFYFVGKIIHIGFTDNAITHEFRYGHDKELLSISKTNANYRVINRCTGVGSSDNLPYYYPNESRKVDVAVEAAETNIALKTSDIIIVDQDKFKKQVSINEELEYKLLNGTEQGDIFLDEAHSYSYWDTKYYEEGQVQSWGRRVYITGEKWEPNQMIMNTSIYTVFETYYEGIYTVNHDNLLYVKAPWDYNNSKPYGWDYITKCFYKEYGTDEWLPAIKMDGTNEYHKIYQLGVVALPAGKKIDVKYFLEIYFTTISEFWTVYLRSYFCTIKYTSRLWTKNGIVINLDRIGIEIVNKIPEIGDKFKQIKVEKDYMITSDKLLPSIYRETWGAERFYNAKNETYLNPDTKEYYQFENEYSEGNPKEQIVSFDYIKPTIKNIKNAAGNLIGEIIDVAFDEEDNDEIDVKTNDYEHKFFYIKLRKFDGDYGFNLFEQGIASGEMTLSMTSGNCAACNFKIGVVEDKNKKNIFYNSVQVDNNGNIVSGNFEEKINSENIQPSQQNTITNEVWIALNKDYDTFGVPMPNYNRNYRPHAGDSFVILNIDLPQSYILAAENELKEAIIKYMAANNSEKFNFSINFKRIFFAQYPEILAQLNENARLIIEYDGSKYALYVSNYTYKVSSDEILPEITVELSDTLTVKKGTLQKSIDAVKADIMTSIGSIDFLKMGLKYFIRKDTDDHADGHLVFRNGLYVTRGAAEDAVVLQEENNSIQEENNAIQEYTATPAAEEPVTPTEMSLGDLTNVKPLVDEPAVEDMVLAKLAGTSEWTQIKKPTGGGGTVSDSNYTSSITNKELITAPSFKELEGKKLSELEGKSFSDIFDMMLFTTLYPTYIVPSATISSTAVYNGQIVEDGKAAPNLSTFSHVFNPGSIVITYPDGTKDTTQGARAGAETTAVYTVNNSSTFPTVFRWGELRYTVTVNYAEGKQPKDSKGNNYGSPLPAGSVSATLIVNVGHNWLAGTETSSSVKGIVIPSTITLENDFAAETSGRYTWRIPKQKTATKMEYYDTNSSRWVDDGLSTNWVITDSNPYWKITNNNPTMRGALKLRLTLTNA